MKKAPVFRGSDFAMRWEQSRWAEERIMNAICRSTNFVALPYGRSQIGPGKPEEIKEYWKKYRGIEGDWKRPDLLVLPRSIYRERKKAWKIILKDPTTTEDAKLRPIINAAICGIEAENSLWIASKMPDYKLSVPLRKKKNIAPNIWVKEEDRAKLRRWSTRNRKPIFVVQVFYDKAYMARLDFILDALNRIAHCKGRIRKDALAKQLGVVTSAQNYYDARTGTTTTKTVYLVHHSVATPFGECTSKPSARPKLMKEKNGKLIPYVRFVGGTLAFNKEARAVFGAL